MSDEQAMAIMRDQHGIISRPQALAAGMTKHEVDRRVRAGVWQREAQGVYRHSATPATPHSTLLAACIAHDGLASHRTAAALHGIDGYELVGLGIRSSGPPSSRLNREEYARLEVTARRGRRRRMPQMTLYQSTQMNSSLARPVTRQEIPCTGFARTIIDLSAVVRPSQIERTLDAVFRDRQICQPDLYSALVNHAAQGRNGCGTLRQALDARIAGEPVPLSDWSRMVADLLAGAGLGYPALEYRVLEADGSFVAQVDLAYPERRLAIELDSRRWHLNSKSFGADRRRNNRIANAGWQVRNFTWEDYSRTPHDLCMTVAKALA